MRGLGGPRFKTVINLLLVSHKKAQELTKMGPYGQANSSSGDSSEDKLGNTDPCQQRQEKETDS